mmetsp:Transcript_3506/g.7756  ORF Transcript_3506/g.7756 Transcript_3506/m.7756 type:complete len:425 (+) Transcript_3506:230-1504(+)|eukprot:CAMPEP_0171493412 /NCGR_PEP_ID=MMETSP0958-20121227/4948_1 /TAXON_ID=87120 /ORGANISM="Aurantiochytrium limacinum, Strain ATCCMYA-1381" /LENGTH=424 /DNA_ID=CAMNT_0012027033 /DNA_START=229 /DNA_END=1503 /DNA_ORIENTATION=-
MSDSSAAEVGSAAATEPPAAPAPVEETSDDADVIKEDAASEAAATAAMSEAAPAPEKGSESVDIESADENTAASKDDTGAEESRGADKSKSTGESDTEALEMEVPQGKVLNVQLHHDEDEVKERLFGGANLDTVKNEAASLWGWFSSKSAELAEQAKTQAQDLAKQAEHLKEHTDSYTERFTQNMKEAAEAADIKRRELVERMQKAAENVSGASDGVLPWEEPASHQFADAIRDRIMELSKDDKTFVVPPPDAVEFSFDFQARALDAVAVMDADSKLREQRFKLVPKEVTEEEFWRNYFYRVSLIKEAYQVSNSSDSRDGSGATGAAGSTKGQRSTSEDHIGATNLPEGPAKGDDDDDVMQGWGHNDDDLDLNENEDENFDMLDDDELLASAGLDLNSDDGNDDDDDDDDDALEKRINAQLNIE